MKRKILDRSPLKLLINGYILILFIACVLINIPIFHKQPQSSLDHIFIATSALSTTGLSPVSISEFYNFGGQFLLLILIQIGGLGYMSIGSFITLIRKNKISKESSELIAYDFSLPSGFNKRNFIKSLIYFAISIEVLGAILLSWMFWLEGIENYIWQGIFHSISAFCTAGFSLFNDSLIQFNGNFWINLVIMILSISGAIGFIVFSDIYSRILGTNNRLSFTSRIILRFTTIGIALGTLLLYLADKSMASLSSEDRLLTALFQSVSAFTTVGFNTYPISDLFSAPIFLIILLMIIGASPSGTGGGLKSTTFVALYSQMKCVLRGKTEVIYLGVRIPQHRLTTATANFFFYIAVIFISVFLLLSFQPLSNTRDLLFEAISALGTVGLSLGETETLTSMGKIIICALMFLGRIGPLSLGLALFGQETDDSVVVDDDLAI